MKRFLAAVPFLLATSTLLRAGDAPSDEACAALAKTLQTSLEEGDADAYDKAMQVEAIVDRAMANCEAPDKLRTDFKAGVLSGSLGKQLAPTLEAGARYVYLRTRRVENQTRLLFRLTTETGSVNFHEYIVEKDGDNAKVTDLYIYLTGETITRTLRREFLKAVAVASKKPADFKGWEKDWYENIDKVTEMYAAQGKGEHDKALKLIAALPESMRADRQIMLAGLLSSQEVSDEAYAKSLDAWQKAFPDDAALDLMMVDITFTRGELENTIKALENLGNKLGGDSFLDYLSGSVRLNQGKPDEARKFAEKAIKAEPTLREAHLLLLTVALGQKDHALTVKQLTVLETQFGDTIADLEEVEGYEDFVESDEYTKWMEKRKK